jgi:GT2 family glycosyltransferase
MNQPIHSGERRVSLVVASYKRPDALATLLASLERQTLPRSRYEVAVVVDGIDEFEPQYREVLENGLRRAGLPLCWEFQKNAGQSVARNRGIAATRAPHVIIVDDDMDLVPSFLAEHLAGLESGARTVVIGNVLPEEGWERQPLYEAVRTKAMLELHQELAGRWRPAQASAFVTQNVSLPRDLYHEVGGLDEKLRLGEDTELGMRLELAKARFLFAEGAAAVHRSRVGSYETWLRRQIEYGRNSVYVHEKLGRHPRTHYLRNLVNGSRLNALAVHALCWSDEATRAGIFALRWLGEGLHRVGLVELGIATHKAILAIAYHHGVKQQLGSWSRLLEAKRAFRELPGRPLDPT